MPRLAASVALRIASGTSRALPWPKPTRPFWSPTTTRAAKPKRRPPFTTFATRLMWTSLSTNSLSRSSRSPRCSLRPRRSPPPLPSSRAILELQAAFAGGVSERLHAPMIDVAAAIEHDLLDALGQGALGDLLADGCRGVEVVGLGGLAFLLVRRGGDEGRCGLVVDDLGVDVLARTEHRKARTPVGVGLDAMARAAAALGEGCEVCGHGSYFFLPSLRRTYSPA